MTEWSGKRSTYFAKEGIKAEQILDNVPDAAVVVFHDEDCGFAKVSPLELLTHIFGPSQPGGHHWHQDSPQVT